MTCAVEYYNYADCLKKYLNTTDVLDSLVDTCEVSCSGLGIKRSWKGQTLPMACLSRRNQ